MARLSEAGRDEGLGVARLAEAGREGAGTSPKRERGREATKRRSDEAAKGVVGLAEADIGVLPTALRGVRRGRRDAAEAAEECGVLPRAPTVREGLASRVARLSEAGKWAAPHLLCPPYLGGRKPFMGLVSQCSKVCLAAISSIAAFTARSRSDPSV